VDEAFRASPSVGVDGLRGRDVTMLLAGGAPRLGDKLLVFANEWVYGVQIALREVGHHKATARAEKEVAEAVERLPLRYLEERLDGAALVIDGEVESIGPSPVPDGFNLRSPNYRLAVVRVASALKGKAGERVHVLFPTNPAPPWRTAPRLREHEHAILILRHETALRAPAEYFTALDPGDVRPRDELNRIKIGCKRKKRDDTGFARKETGPMAIKVRVVNMIPQSQSNETNDDSSRDLVAPCCSLLARWFAHCPWNVPVIDPHGSAPRHHSTQLLLQRRHKALRLDA
jgi:hypothetical protein